MKKHKPFQKPYITEICEWTAIACAGNLELSLHRRGDFRHFSDRLLYRDR